jgi:hypothetical protein
MSGDPIIATSLTGLRCEESCSCEEIVRGWIGTLPPKITSGLPFSTPSEIDDDESECYYYDNKDRCNQKGVKPP